MLEQYDFEVILEAGSGAELLGKLDRDNLPDVVLLDINMPGMNGVLAAERLHEFAPEIKILMCTMSSEASWLAAAMSAGASGYVLKESFPEEIINAIETVYRGEPYFSKAIMPQVAEVLAGFYKRNVHQGETMLNSVEREVLRLIADGHTVSDIARHLLVSSRTIDGYKSKIMSKLGVQSAVGMILAAIRLGILSADPPESQFHKINKPIS